MPQQILISMERGFKTEQGVFPAPAFNIFLLII